MSLVNRKHIGIENGTGARLVILMIDQHTYSKNPADEGFCLVANIDTIPELLQQQFIERIETPEAQAANCLIDVIGRYTLGNGVNMVEYLRTTGRIRRMPHSEVSLTPNSYTVVQLSEVVNSIKSQQVTSDVGRAGDRSDPTPAEMIAKAEALEQQATELRNLAVKMVASVPAMVLEDYPVPEFSGTSSSESVE